MGSRGTDGAWILGETDQYLIAQTGLLGSWHTVSIKRAASGSGLNTKWENLP